MKSRQSKPDHNQTAARIVGESASKHEDALPADIEATWDAWIAGVGKVDQRAATLLRAAFEVGVAAAKRSVRNRP